MVCCFYQLVLKKNMEFITNELKYVWFKSVMIKILWICFVLFPFGQLFACFGSKFIVIVFHQIILFKEFCFSKTGVFYGGGKKADQSQRQAVQTQTKGWAGVSVILWVKQTWAAGVRPMSRGRVGVPLPHAHFSAGSTRPFSCGPAVTAAARRSLHTGLPVTCHPHASSCPGEIFLSS